MRLLAATTILAVVIAATASVFAIWPVVADAPWEDTTVPVVEDRTDEIRCEGALSYRNSIIEAGRYSSGGETSLVPGLGESWDTGPGNPGGLRNYDEALAEAEREIDRYC